MEKQCPSSPCLNHSPCLSSTNTEWLMIQGERDGYKCSGQVVQNWKKRIPNFSLTMMEGIFSPKPQLQRAEVILQSKVSKSLSLVKDGVSHCIRRLRGSTGTWGFDYEEFCEVIKMLLEGRTMMWSDLLYLRPVFTAQWNGWWVGRKFWVKEKGHTHQKIEANTQIRNANS